MTNSKRLLIGGGVCWLGFLIFMLAYLHGRAWLKSYDTFGYQLTQPATPAKTVFLRGLTTLGEPAVLGGATIVLMLYLWWRRQIGDSMWYGAVNFIGSLLLFAVKHTVLRPRPSHQLVSIGGYSFPSGHTFGMTVFVLTVVALLWPHLQRRWERWLLALLAAIIILAIMDSRVYLRVHYASDVTAGLLLAAGWFMLATALRPHLHKWLIEPITTYPD
ncbi:phosphatase PAP2 family protein [Limosilactobacillus oris]|uniref:phosphatase PAP2 family protein n=1 Tax=Limosilactobacillus oris TaxID=1632 RepID=UPI00174A9C1D|nr:phosphatase PAP2 family protein [Limosilactobacillus oris]